MKIPTDSMIGNLRFTDSGQVWADYLLTGRNYGLKNPKDKEKDRVLHQALFRSLPGESLLLGVASGLDPLQTVERMLAGVDPDACPEWMAECEATMATLEQLRPGQRVFWLSVPLAGGGIGMKMRAVMHGLEAKLALPASPPTAETVSKFIAKSRQVVENIPSMFAPTPATPAQMVWLHQHMLDRGLYLDASLPEPITASVPRGRTALPAPLLDEGGRTDDPKRAVFNPLKRRFLKVQSPLPGDEDAASYQSMLLLGDVPDGEIPFPGGELLGRVDECGLPVDWAMRLTVKSSTEVLSKNRRALETLNEQFSQREGEMSHGLGSLDMAAEALQEYAAILESDKLEMECQATIVFSVAAPTALQVISQAKAVANWASQAGYRLSQPIGYQEQMWWQMHPGVATSALTREYAQITTSAALSSMVPLATSNVGDSRGTLLGININNGPMLDAHTPCGQSSLVYHNPAGAIDRNVAGSFAVVGDKGAGKSFLLKKEAGAILDKGGRIIVSDRTTMGEWALWAQALTNPCIVDVSDPKYSMDPLRIFDQATGSRVAQSFLTALLDIAPTSIEGVLLSEVLDPDYLQPRGIHGLGALAVDLADHCTLAGAKELARLMRVFARKSIGRIVFDDSLPVLDLNHQAIVIRTHQLSLPTRSELDHAHLFRQIGVEKLFGRAFFALIAAIAKLVCFQDRRQFAAFVLDEAHAVTISGEGTQELIDFIRDDRKHGACLMLGSHDPMEDFPSETMRGLIPFRILMRHTDKTLAQNGLRWLDLDPDDEALIELITKDTSPVVGEEVPVHRRGECLIRDSAGDVGRVKILTPALASRDQAARTGGDMDLVA